MGFEESLLQFLANETFCSEAEIWAFVRLQDGTHNQAAALLAMWQAHGWVEKVGQGESQLPPLFTLTDRAYEAHPWLVRAT